MLLAFATLSIVATAGAARADQPLIVNGHMNGMDWTADGLMLAVADGGYGRTRVWDKFGTLVHEVPGFAFGTDVVAFEQGGARLCTCGVDVEGVANDLDGSLYEVAPGKDAGAKTVHRVRCVSTSDWKTVLYDVIPLRAMSASATGGRLAVAMFPHGVALYALDDSKTRTLWSDSIESVWTISGRPDLIVRLTDSINWKQRYDDLVLWSGSSFWPREIAATTPYSTSAVSRDRSRLLVAFTDSVELFDIDSGVSLGTYAFKDGTFGRDWPSVSFGGADDVIFIAGGRQLQRLDGVTLAPERPGDVTPFTIDAVAANPRDGSWVAIGGYGTAVLRRLPPTQ